MPVCFGSASVVSVERSALDGSLSAGDVNGFEPKIAARGRRRGSENFGAVHTPGGLCTGLELELLEGLELQGLELELLELLELELLEGLELELLEGLELQGLELELLEGLELQGLELELLELLELQGLELELLELLELLEGLELQRGGLHGRRLSWEAGCMATLREAAEARWAAGRERVPRTDVEAAERELRDATRDRSMSNVFAVGVVVYLLTK